MIEYGGIAHEQWTQKKFKDELKNTHEIYEILKNKIHIFI